VRSYINLCVFFQALTTAVWSVLKAKKRMLKFPNGFMSHFYVISEQISPLMAWGFFGPNENLRTSCTTILKVIIINVALATWIHLICQV